MKLIDKLPYFYEECPKVNTIQEGLGSETERLYSKVRATTDQLYVNSATWGLAEWEKFAGVKRTSGTIEQRRARVIAKLTAKGTTTLEVFTNICKAYAGEVEVEEIYKEYALSISLIDKKDTLSPIEYRLDEMDEAIFEVKPAHLNHYFKCIQSRKLGVKAGFEDILIKYIPCNSAYAGQYQPNTYNREKELYSLPDSYNKRVSVLGEGVLGDMILGGVK